LLSPAVPLLRQSEGTNQMKSYLIALALVAGVTSAANTAVAQGRYYGGPSRPSIARNLEARYYAPPAARYDNRGSAARQYSYYQGNRYNYRSPYRGSRTMFFDRPGMGGAALGFSLELGP